MNQITESSMVQEASVDERSRGHGGTSIHQRPVENAVAKKSVMGRLVKSSMLAVVLISGGVFVLYKMRVNIPALNTSKLYAHLDSMGVRAEQLKGRVVAQYEAYFHKQEGEAHHEEHQLTVTSPLAMDVIIKQEYVCQIHSKRHIDVCALEDGYLQAIPIKEGQAVREGDVLFSVNPVLYKAKWDAEVAERDLAQLELDFSTGLANKNGVSTNEPKLFKAKLAKAKAKVDQAEAEFNFTKVKAQFDGIVDRLRVFQGSLVKEGDILTTLHDNSVMWVYFNVPEKRYLEYMAETGQNKLNLDVILMLANHDEFSHPGKIDLANKVGAIAANFNNQTGNIAFRADFPNPDGLLRHGQTGTVVINRALKGAIVIPQRATFENLAKRYVFIVGEDDVVKQREIFIEHEMEDTFVIKKGILDEKDKILLEGIRQVREGEKLEKFTTRKPQDVLKDLKFKAE